MCSYDDLRAQIARCRPTRIAVLDRARPARSSAPGGVHLPRFSSTSRSTRVDRDLTSARPGEQLAPTPHQVSYFALPVSARGAADVSGDGRVAQRGV
jgi:hypothetical protein